MFARYTRIFLMALLIISALAACGSTAAEPVATPMPQPTSEADSALEAAQAVDEILSGDTPSSKDIAPYSLPLDAPLPRTVKYASMDWTITEAKIDNTVISLFGSDKRTDEYHAARLTLRIDNPLSSYPSIDRDIVRLRLDDGKLYSPDSDTPVDLPHGHDQTETKMAFRVPTGATWKNAALVIGEADKIPAEMALEGPIAKPEFPMALPDGATATARRTDYDVLSAALDLDFRDKRAEQGKRYLELMMRVTYNGSPNLAVTEDSFRLIVDGAPLAPISSMIELVDANSAKDGEVVFEIPADAAKVALQVGEAVEGDTAKIPLDLTATAASR